MTTKKELAAKSRKYYAENTEKCRARMIKYNASHYKERRASRLANQYGLSIEGFEELLNKQNNRCAVCGTTNWGYHGPAIDHDHGNGRVRGILCNHCNVAAGNLRDDPEKARALAKYLDGVIC